MSEPNPLVESMRDYAWNYFSLHAEQRTKMFHFFIILETATLAGLLVSVKGTSGILSSIPKAFAVLPIMMTLFSFVFWKLDGRTRGLIRIAEAALHAYENDSAARLDAAMSGPSRLFHNDDSTLATDRPLRYSHCFGIVFLSFALLGIAATFWVVFLQ